MVMISDHILQFMKYDSLDFPTYNCEVVEGVPVDMEYDEYYSNVLADIYIHNIPVLFNLLLHLLSHGVYSILDNDEELEYLIKEK